MEATPAIPAAEPAKAQKAVIQAEALDHQGELSWEDLKLSPELLKGLAKKGFTKPSNIQERSLPDIILRRKGFVGQAVNGSGKTACFSLSMLGVCDPMKKVPQAICLSHTQELARQNLEVVKELGQFTAFTYHLLTPGEAPLPPTTGPMPQIICATPGSVAMMVKKRKLPLDDICLFVLDEADVMVDPNQNFSANILELHRKCPAGVQTVCFSATYKANVRSFAMAITKNCTNGFAKITIKDDKLKIDCISQHYLRCRREAGSKLQVLKDLYNAMSIGQSVIFINKREDAQRIAKELTAGGFSVSVLVGGKDQNSMDNEQRSQVMKEFRDGVSKVLIATDVLSRGIDVPAVMMVINYDLPYGLVRQVQGTSPMETYLHRIGRTGRFGQPGLAINFVTDGSDDMEGIRMLEEKYSHTISEIECDPEYIQDIMTNLRKKIEVEEEKVEQEKEDEKEAGVVTMK